VRECVSARVRESVAPCGRVDAVVGPVSRAWCAWERALMRSGVGD
jgi:hypothetical protein